MLSGFITCKNCGNNFEGNFCNRCGQKRSIKRFALTNISSEFIHGFFHWDKGLLYTIKELFVRPGVMLSEYLEGRRVNYFNPFTYLVLVSIAGGFFHAGSGLSAHTDNNWLGTPEAVEFTSNHFSVRLMLAIPVYAIMSFIFFRKAKYNLAEHLVINTYMINQVALLFTMFFILLNIIPFSDKGHNLVLLLMDIAGVGYPLLVYMQLFKNNSVLLRLVKSIVVLVAALFLNFYLVNKLIGLII